MNEGLTERYFKIAGLGIFGFGAAVIYVNWRFFPRLSPGNQAAMIASSLGAMGTLVLATATLVSVRQQAATIEDLQKDREKPLVIDEINHVIDFAIRGAERNKSTIRDDVASFNWVRVKAADEHTPGTGPDEVIQNDPDETAETSAPRECSLHLESHARIRAIDYRTGESRGRD